MERGRAPTRETFERLRAEREEALADVRERLGEERYDTLRSLGGLGMLAEALDCDG